jgi:hypothetical protein
MTAYTRSFFVGYGISHVLDDALSSDHTVAEFVANGRGVLVGFQCGFDQLLVGVMSYLPDCTVDDDEAIEIAEDYLRDIGWLKADTETYVYRWQQLAE